MPLIVAVEQEREQIEHLTGLAARVIAELRVADSVVAALGLMEVELPDVILVSSLVSPADELALGLRLRDLGPAAAHVQVLMMPHLEPAGPPASGRMLSFRRTRKPRGTRPSAAVDSFAERLTVYLERARAVRHTPRLRITPLDVFDPSEPRFVALLARLDQIVQRT